MNAFIDLCGHRYGQLAVLHHIGSSRYECQCDCGNTTIVQAYNLRNGHTRSCGCLKNKPYNLKHGLHKSPLYNVYMTMKARCYNKNYKEYYLYGGRGIKICDEWLAGVSTFSKWAEANGYKKGLAIDRINNDGNYEPLNCRFVTPAENARNKRNNIKWNGETASEASRRLGGGDLMVSKRVRAGWPLEKAFTTPVTIR